MDPLTSNHPKSLSEKAKEFIDFHNNEFLEDKLLKTVEEPWNDAQEKSFSFYPNEIDDLFSRIQRILYHIEHE